MTCLALRVALTLIPVSMACGAAAQTITYTITGEVTQTEVGYEGVINNYQLGDRITLSVTANVNPLSAIESSYSTSYPVVAAQVTLPNGWEAGTSGFYEGNVVVINAPQQQRPDMLAAHVTTLQQREAFTFQLNDYQWLMLDDMRLPRTTTNFLEMAESAFMQFTHYVPGKWAECSTDPLRAAECMIHTTARITSITTSSAAGTSPTPTPTPTKPPRPQK